VTLDDPDGEQLIVNGGLGGSNGGNGGSITSANPINPIEINVQGGSANSNYSVSLSGGTGNENGGDGGIISDVEMVAEGEGKSLLLVTAGGSATSEDGVAADGANAHVVVNGNFENVGITSQGGAGEGGADGADGGDLLVEVNGKTKSIIISSIGGRDDDGLGGEGGEMMLTLRNETGDVITQNDCETCGNGTSGHVTVVLENGAKVTGTITNQSGENATLKFALQAASKAEFDSVSAALLRAGANGYIEVNGNKYEWFGFTSFDNAMTYAIENNPDQPIKVVVNDGGSSSNPGEAFPSGNFNHAANDSFKCTTSKLTAAQQADGSILLSVQANAIGTIENLKYQAVNDDYAVQLGQNNGRLIAIVSTLPAHKFLGSCRLNKL